MLTLFVGLVVSHVRQYAQAKWFILVYMYIKLYFLHWSENRPFIFLFSVTQFYCFMMAFVLFVGKFIKYFQNTIIMVVGNFKGKLKLQ